jgi:hypothetical protein
MLDGALTAPEQRRKSRLSAEARNDALGGVIFGVHRAILTNFPLRVEEVGRGVADQRAMPHTDVKLSD